MEKYNELLNPLQTDFYQFTMIYSYWRNNKHKEPSTFDLYYRKNPFQSKYSILAGIDEVKLFLKGFSFKNDDVSYLKKVFPNAEEEFFDYLQNMKMDDIEVKGLSNNQIIIPHIPLLTLKGELAKIQLIETPLLNFINYPSLIITLAKEVKIRFPTKKLIEIGSENSQTSYGGILGLKYILNSGLVDSTSNSEAGYLTNSEIFSYISINNEYSNSNQMTEEVDFSKEKFKLLIEKKNFPSQAKEYLMTISNTKYLSILYNIILSEYSGNLLFKYILNCIENEEKEKLEKFIEIIKILIKLQEEGGISKQQYNKIKPTLYVKALNFNSNINKKLEIIMNHINNELQLKNNYDNSLYEIGVKFDFNMLNIELDQSFLNTIFLDSEFITCSQQPAMGMVYKIMEINNVSTMKFSEEKEKSTIPGDKVVYRLYDNEGNIIGDYLTLENNRIDDMSMKKSIYGINYKHRSQGNFHEIQYDHYELLTKNLVISEENKRERIDINTCLKINSIELFLSKELMNLINEISEKNKIS